MASIELWWLHFSLRWNFHHWESTSGILHGDGRGWGHHRQSPGPGSPSAHSPYCSSAGHPGGLLPAEPASPMWRCKGHLDSAHFLLFLLKLVSRKGARAYYLFPRLLNITNVNSSVSLACLCFLLKPVHVSSPPSILWNKTVKKE